MFGAISGGVLLEYARMMGYREQLNFLDEFPPCIYIDRDKLCNVPIGYSWDDTTTYSTTDHPAFTQLRIRLEKEGYIETQTWVNGDRVTKPFYLNNMYFDIGDRFLCAVALGIQYDIAKRKNNRDPEYGGLTDRSPRSRKNAECTERDTAESETVSEALPLFL